MSTAEMFGGHVQTKARACDLAYMRLPIRRNAITTDDLEQFYASVFEQTPKPMYVFSRTGREPLALLLLFDAVARGETFDQVALRASVFGTELTEDLCLKKFPDGSVAAWGLGTRTTLRETLSSRDARPSPARDRAVGVSP